MIGKLSRKYESRGNPGAIGNDPQGGWSYGQCQIATKTGTFAVFLRFLHDHYPNFAAILEDAGGVKSATEGTETFKRTWTDLANTQKEGFSDAQHEFLVETHCRVAIDILKKFGIDLSNRSDTLADVVFSLAIAAGPGSVKTGKGAAGIIAETIKRIGKPAEQIDDATLIEETYKTKLDRIDRRQEYARVTDGIRKSVRSRFVNESRDAEQMLAEEIASKSLHV